MFRRLSRKQQTYLLSGISVVVIFGAFLLANSVSDEPETKVLGTQVENTTTTSIVGSTSTTATNRSIANVVTTTTAIAQPTEVNLRSSNSADVTMTADKQVAVTSSKSLVKGQNSSVDLTVSAQQKSGSTITAFVVVQNKSNRNLSINSRSIAVTISGGTFTTVLRASDVGQVAPGQQKVAQVDYKLPAAGQYSLTAIAKGVLN